MFLCFLRSSSSGSTPPGPVRIVPATPYSFLVESRLTARRIVHVELALQLRLLVVELPLRIGPRLFLRISLLPQSLLRLRILPFKLGPAFFEGALLCCYVVRMHTGFRIKLSLETLIAYADVVFMLALLLVKLLLRQRLLLAVICLGRLARLMTG